jgi:hypothetical protein
MSDTATIPSQIPVLDGSVGDQDYETSSSSSRRTLLIAVLGGVVALAAVAYFLVFAGGDPEDSAPVAKAPVATADDPADADAPAAVKQPKITQKNYGRDPYKALIVEDTGSADGTATTSGVATGTTGGTTTDTSTGTGTSPTGSTSGGTTTGTTAPVQTTAHRFKVVEVAPDNRHITVKVDGEFYRNLKAGEVFATYFKVVLISGTVNSFQFGDDKFNVIGTKALAIA